jgi:5-oxoprolinase (ATP-hydrolysing) subunit B
VTRTVRPMGDRALLVECDDDDPAGLAQAVRAAGLGGVVDVVPAACTVLVTVARAEALPAVADVVRSAVAAGPAPDGDLVTLPVTYDGPDLEAVAAATGLGVDEVAARHGAATYRVAFCGFAPGFAYLTGLDPALVLPRRAEPRTRVPAGSVAVAGAFTAVYPGASPGGWHLLGTCPTPLWHPDTNPPSRLTPGMRVRFEAG